MTDDILFKAQNLRKEILTLKSLLTDYPGVMDLADLPDTRLWRPSSTD